MATTVLVIGFFLLFLLRVSATTAMGLSSVAALLVSGQSLVAVPRFLVSGIDSFVLLAVPFFILAGNLFNASGATTRIFRFAEAMFGWIPGGLAQVNIGASFIFSGMTGAALADIAGIGTITLKVMADAGYRARFGASISLASSVLGPLLPPSIMFILYASSTNVSVGRLFMAGTGAAIVVVAILMLFVVLSVRFGLEPCPPPQPFSLRRLGSATRSAWLALLTPVIILGAMRGGVVTATEAGVMAVCYALLLATVYRSVNLAALGKAAVAATIMSASILYLIAVSTLMGHILTEEGVAHSLSAAIAGITASRSVMLLIVNVMLLLIGSVLETTPALLITAPILLPMVQSFGVDSVHFGVILCFNLIIGILHPPMGIGLFVMSSISRQSVEALSWAILPFLVPLLISLALITYVPEISLWLPNLLYGAD
jgi:tripartite ATP-independent transporter DctM subunit